MEIEFNPSQLPASRASGAASGSPARPPDALPAPQLAGMAELQSKLDQLALTRPDKMGAVEPLVSNVKYPPDELLNGIAHLLAIKLKQ